MAAAGWAVLAQSPRDDVTEDDEASALERRIDNTVRARAEVISLQTADIVCRVAGESAVVELVEEGANVKKGDVLVRLDDAPWRDRATAQEAAVIAAQAAVEQAKATLELRQQERADGRDASELAVRAAEAAREKYLGKDGEYAVQLKAIESQIAVAAERVKTAEAILKAAMDAGEGGGPAERLMIQRQTAEAKLAILEAKTALETAQAKRQLLVTRELAHQTAALDLALVEAKATLNRTRRQAEAAVAQAQADLKAREAALVQENLNLARIRSTIERCTLRAPRDGYVVYAGPRRRTGSNTLEVGGKVQDHQLLLQMPDTSRLGLRALVNETRIGRVKVGQSVMVEPLVGRTRLRGKVASIANQPDQRSWLSSDVREYAVIVTLDEMPNGWAKPGMSAMAEIDVSP
jgi:multidrug resistance efflux pump